MVNNNRKEQICPRCHKMYNEHPALSRRDNKTDICSKCGTMEALVDFLKYTNIPTEDFLKNSHSNTPEEFKFSAEQFEVERKFKAYLKQKKFDNLGREDTQGLIQKDLLLDD